MNIKIQEKESQYTSPACLRTGFPFKCNLLCHFAPKLRRAYFLKINISTVVLRNILLTKQ